MEFEIAAGDCETDPFESGVVPKPFVWGFYSESEGYIHFWDEQHCTEQFVEWLLQQDKPYKIYMHNGGKFDFMFLMKYFHSKIKIVNGRILEARIGHHLLRDSYAAVPIPLAAYKKDDIDYQKLHKSVRHKNRSEIINYLGGDVRYLHEMMTAYREEFGDVLTIGTAAMKELESLHTYETFTQPQDALFREFYYGGRCQCFETGWIEGDFKVYDINSSYPDVMRRLLHPVSNTWSESRALDDDTDFVRVTGRNYGALPMRVLNGSGTIIGLDFAAQYGTFSVTGHELRMALETGTFDIHRIESAYTFHERMTFQEFIDTWYAKRLGAKDAGLDLYVLFYKLIMNSSYGKFCLNSENFKDWEITEAGDYLDIDIWTPEIEHGDYVLWSKPTAQTRYLNVATGASITGGARASLLSGLSKATRPIYCDTDSIICESLSVDSDAKRLGAWKHEATGRNIAIAGKKLYALYNGDVPFVDEKGKDKKASKGVRLTADEIRRVALGEPITYASPVPAFKLDGRAEFTTRTVTRTDRNIVRFGA